MPQVNLLKNEQCGSSVFEEKKKQLMEMQGCDFSRFCIKVLQRLFN